MSIEAAEKALARVQAARQARDHTGVLFESVLALTQVTGTLNDAVDGLVKAVAELNTRVQALESARDDGR